MIESGDDEQFGLKSLADKKVVEIVASVEYWSKSSLAVRHFGQVQYSQYATTYFRFASLCSLSVLLCKSDNLKITIGVCARDTYVHVFVREEFEACSNSHLGTVPRCMR